MANWLGEAQEARHYLADSFMRAKCEHRFAPSLIATRRAPLSCLDQMRRRAPAMPDDATPRTFRLCVHVFPRQAHAVSLTRELAHLLDRYRRFARTDPAPFPPSHILRN